MHPITIVITAVRVAHLFQPHRVDIVSPALVLVHSALVLRQMRSCSGYPLFGEGDTRIGPVNP
jgi:hypothetical protein